MRASVIRDHITLSVGGLSLKGDLALPLRAHAVVIFTHGSGSNRKNPRNRGIARALEHVGFATLLVDLLTSDEETAEHGGMARSFEVAPLADRLVGATDWISAQPALRPFALGYFGAGTGAAVALAAAAERPATVRAVVSQAGRTDLIDAVLARVEAPTLLVVDGDDPGSVEQGRITVAKMHCERGISSVAGASHLLNEAGALRRVAELAAQWFDHHLHQPGTSPKPWGPGGPAHCEAFGPGHRDSVP